MMPSSNDNIYLQGAGFRLLLVLCPAFEVSLPGFIADGFTSALPSLETADGDSLFSCKGFLSQAEGLPIRPDTIGLSVV